MKDEIKSAYKDANITLTPKTGGFFDVIVDDIMIFQRQKKLARPLSAFQKWESLFHCFNKQVISLYM
ncbi:Rdx family protein [Sulfurospirillum diekertiae]|uniref:Rdx family protein n=1 Tax=Sulfurospirillum diekertiae TaxID=1854492 RepID=UPI0013748247